MAFKKTSSIIAVSNRVETSAPNTFTQLEMDLALDPLNNEVFVVLAVDFALAPPSAVAATDTTTLCQLSTTSFTGIAGMEQSNIIARGENHISAAGYVDGGVGFSHMSNDTPTGDLDYIGIVATPNMYLAVDSLACTAVKACAVRVWGYRARLDSAGYAALVQSEVLSA